MKTPNTKLRMTIQLWVATILVFAGLALLVAGFIVKPLGEIHNSVLIAFGEISTFSGALFGVDYSYRYNAKAPRKKRSEGTDSNVNSE